MHYTPPIYWCSAPLDERMLQQRLQPLAKLGDLPLVRERPRAGLVEHPHACEGVEHGHGHDQVLGEDGKAAEEAHEHARAGGQRAERRGDHALLHRRGLRLPAVRAATASPAAAAAAATIGHVTLEQLCAVVPLQQLHDARLPVHRVQRHHRRRDREAERQPAAQARDLCRRRRLLRRHLPARCGGRRPGPQARDLGRRRRLLRSHLPARCGGRRRVGRRVGPRLAHRLKARPREQEA